MIGHRHEYEKMAHAEQLLWWYRALHHLVVEALEQHPKARAVQALDAGCGTGGLLLFLRERGFTHVRGFDVSTDAVQICHERKLPVAQGDLRQFAKVVGSNPVEAIISNDTLCYFHSGEQLEILRLFWEALAPGGMLILNLPALPAFRGIHDLSVGIQQRFTKRQVAGLIAEAGFATVRSHYWPFLLSPFIYIVRLSQRCRMQCLPRYQIKSDTAMPPLWLNRLFERATRFENRRLAWKPIGSSLFVVATR